MYGETTKSSSTSPNNSLYELIWKPLEKLLARTRTVTYAPSGLLHRISFQALRPDARHLLIDRYQLIQVLSTRAIALPMNGNEKPGSASIWGNIDYDSTVSIESSVIKAVPTRFLTDTTASSFDFYASDTKSSRGGEWNRLPGTKQEIDSLRKMFSQAGISTTLDSGKMATEEDFKALSGNSPQVIHLATHGFFLPALKRKPNKNEDLGEGGKMFSIQENPMFRSGLVLAGGNHTWKGSTVMPGNEDGILTAYEIAQLDLSGTDLLVLSACETALGDLQGTEGVIGLQRAFKMAGVKQLIISLWRVPDKETMKLMTLFYRNWLSGQSCREALRQAQLKMKEKYPPYYWAAFVLVE
jgi:CHAT domain-containing protein